MTWNFNRQPLRIRRMTQADLDKVMEIEKASFASPWSRRSFEAELLMNGLYSHLWVAVLGDKVVGFLCFQCITDDAHIINFAVHPHYRQRGYGRQLLRHCLAQAVQLGARRVSLEVRVSNVPAITLYQQMGFRVLARRHRFYPDNGEDAYVMVYPLGNGENA